MVDFVHLPELSSIATFLALVGIIFGPNRFKTFFTLLALVVNTLVTSWMAITALTVGELNLTIHAGTLLGNIPIRVDGLSAWFILIINFTCLTGFFYGTGYLRSYSEANKKLRLHWILYVLFHLSMLWVCMLQNGLAFLIAWEIMSISSMLLVIFDHNNPQTIKAGINYLVQMHISIVFLTVGFIWVYFKTGSFSFEAIQQYFNLNSNLWLFLVFFTGFGLKAGFIPLHSWLPHAHPAAPSHVSGVMSGVIVKLGIYGIIRMGTFLQADFILLGEIIITVSILTGIYGILNAAVYRDFKRMLAYCTIENIGIIGIGIGIGLIGLGNGSSMMYYLGFGGALIHVLNHALYKSLLFYAAGSVYQQTHTRDMDQLGGLIKNMPKTAVIFLIGALAIGGLPPFNGFVSEFIIYSGLMEGLKSNDLGMISLLILTFAGLSIIGGISILTFTKSFGTIFLGSPRVSFHHQPKEVSQRMLVPQYFIIAIMLSVAFFPQLYLNTIGTILKNMCFAGTLPDINLFQTYSDNISNISIYSALFTGIALALWGIRSFSIRNTQQLVGPTWGCAYVAPNNRMQYTGKSFSKPLGKIFSFLLIEKKQYKEIVQGEIFPKKRKYSSFYHDFFERRFIDTITQRMVYSANYFKFIQNGRIQSYVLYGILFIMAVFILSALNIIK